MNEPLPRLLLIADRFAEPGVDTAVLQAVAGGVQWVHLRDHAAPPARFAAVARVLVPVLQARGVRISLNTYVALAAALQTGAHLGVRGPAPAPARALLGPAALLGRSVHAGDVLTDADRALLNYVVFGPVYPTGSKPGHPGTGVEALADFCRQHGGLPVYALGGITPERVSACLAAGAFGVAVLSGILQAPDPELAAGLYLEALRAARAEAPTVTP